MHRLFRNDCPLKRKWISEGVKRKGNAKNAIQNKINTSLASDFVNDESEYTTSENIFTYSESKQIMQTQNTNANQNKIKLSQRDSKISKISRNSKLSNQNSSNNTRQ